MPRPINSSIHIIKARMGPNWMCHVVRHGKIVAQSLAGKITP